MTELETNILAIDPGVTTGIALVNPQGDFVRGYEVQPHDLHIVREMLRLYPDAAVLIEKGPAFESHNRPYMEQVERIVEEDGREDISWVTPSQWKNSPTNRREVPKGSKHMADCVRMARWHQKTRRHSEASNAQRDSSRAHQIPS